jgi:hypothetical protein
VILINKLNGCVSSPGVDSTYGERKVSIAEPQELYN